MIRKHWRELGFWRWWWHDNIRFEVKAVATVIVLALMLGGEDGLVLEVEIGGLLERCIEPR